MADEDSVLEEAMDNLKEAGERIRATKNLMRSHGMTENENYRDLLTRRGRRAPSTVAECDEFRVNLHESSARAGRALERLS